MGLGLKNLVTGSLSGLLDSAKPILDKFIQDPAQKAEALQALTNEANRHQEALLIEADSIEKAYLADTQDARQENTKIQESPNASWLAKNVGYCLDIFITLVFSSMLTAIIFKEVPVDNKELFYTGFGLLGSYVGQIIGYHRGSSSGSKAKQESLDKLMIK